MQLFFENVLHLYINCKVLNNCELTHDQILCVVGWVYEYYYVTPWLPWFFKVILVSFISVEIPAGS